MSTPVTASHPMVPGVAPWSPPPLQPTGPANPAPMTGDTYIPSATSPATPAPAGKVGVMSFFSNLWDQFLGPLLNKASSFLMALLGK
ncbi:MAG: hypothetical protein VKO21_03825 [Candidatus Sericytochromatia bacterium]|nr:hypothetical protein [Candidatus Sericytochromatia bacterium]